MKYDGYDITTWYDIMTYLLPVDAYVHRWNIARTDAEPPSLADYIVKKDKPLPPMNCINCNHHNEYVGPEHLDEHGRYLCRTCKRDKK